MTLDRRGFLAACSRAGIASPLLPGILYTLAAQAQQASPDTKEKPRDLPKITPEMLDQAAEMADVGPFTDAQKKMMLEGLNDQRDGYEQIRALKLPNSVAPAYVFHPLPAGASLPRAAAQISASSAGETTLVAPARIEDLAFASIAELSGLIRARKITALALTQMYLDRLKHHDAQLHFLTNLTEERALAQARAADAEIAAGKYRGPLHGIPWGAKDLLAVKGYPTTWGAGGFEHQVIDEDATVVARLDAAGAILVAKLTL
ncbi:MAG: amidase family protein, partial [Terracidiphilus sp.]